MRADITREWTAEALSHALNVSPSTLYRVFKRALAMPPLTWYKRLRMTNAAEQLGTPHLRIADVAAAVGYDDPFHFSRDFRKHFGVSPRAYRQAEYGHNKAEGNP